MAGDSSTHMHMTYVVLHEVTWCIVVWRTQNAPRLQQFHVAPAMSALLSTPLQWILKNVLQKASHSCRITCKRSESAWEQRIARHKSDQQQGKHISSWFRSTSWQFVFPSERQCHCCRQLHFWRQFPCLHTQSRLCCTLKKIFKKQNNLQVCAWWWCTSMTISRWMGSTVHNVQASHLWELEPCDLDPVQNVLFEMSDTSMTKVKAAGGAKNR